MNPRSTHPRTHPPTPPGGGGCPQHRHPRNLTAQGAQPPQRSEVRGSASARLIVQLAWAVVVRWITWEQQQPRL